ncbi:MAG: phosphoribosylamine--glycine ligase, partial [Treponema sp.]|nr:phosphoribosylamine--glycine ligase [Treponema sp.]
MKVLVIGNGGREHTIAWRLAQSNLIEDVICVPGNGGTAVESKCRNIDPKDSPALANLSRNEVAVSVAKSEKVDFAVIGPEDPLA